MKYFGLIVLGTLVSTVSYGAKYDDNAITGSCTQTLGGKKANRKSYKNDTSIKGLKTVLRETGEFTVNQLRRHRIKNTFVRVIPFPSDPLVYRKHQITVFEDEFSRISTENPSIPMAKKAINGDLDIKFSYSNFGEPTVFVDVTGLATGPHTNHERKSYTFSGGRAEVNVDLDIFFDYQDYSFTGFLGLKGWMNDEIEKDEIETHKVSLVTKCVFMLDEIVDNSDRDKKKDVPAQRIEKKDEKHINPGAEDFGEVYVGGAVQE